jgi:hypothetical protein
MGVYDDVACDEEAEKVVVCKGGTLGLELIVRPPFSAPG